MSDPIVTPLTCSAGCGTDVSGRALTIRGGVYCTLCGPELALAVIDEKGATQADVSRAREVLQIAILWRLMQNENPGAAKYTRELEKVGLLARGVARRCADSNLPKAEEWCGSILAAVEGLEAGVDRTASMHLLGHASLSLNHVFHSEKSAGDVLGEIDATVAIIRARDMSALEAKAS